MKENTDITPLHQRLRDARRGLGMTQSALAEAVACKQSAISMMERGRMSVLANATLARIGEVLGVELPEQESVSCPTRVTVSAVTTYCPTFDCPSNLPYVVGGVLMFLPTSNGGASHCAYCGELVEARCPQCGAAAEAGACCRGCGTAYVTSEGLDLPHQERWADEQRERIRQIVR